MVNNHRATEPKPIKYYRLNIKHVLLEVWENLGLNICDVQTSSSTASAHFSTLPTL